MQNNNIYLLPYGVMQSYSVTRHKPPVFGVSIR